MSSCGPNSIYDLIDSLHEEERLFADLESIYNQINELASQIPEPPFDDDAMAKINQIADLRRQFYVQGRLYLDKAIASFSYQFNPCLGTYATHYRESVTEMALKHQEMIARVEAMASSFGIN